MNVINTLNYGDVKPFVDEKSERLTTEGFEKFKSQMTEVEGNHYAFLLYNYGAKTSILLLENQNLLDTDDIFEDVFDTLTDYSQVTLQVLKAIAEQTWYQYTAYKLLVPSSPRVSGKNPSLQQCDFIGTEHSITLSRDLHNVYGYIYNYGETPILPLYKDGTNELEAFAVDSKCTVTKEHTAVLTLLVNTTQFEDKTYQGAYDLTLAYFRELALNNKVEEIKESKEGVKTTAGISEDFRARD